MQLPPQVLFGDQGAEKLLIQFKQIPAQHLSASNPPKLEPNVSILTRPEDRMLHTDGTVYQLLPLFQSSPGPKTGCF